MTICIWCKGVDAPSAVEHIIPEALGCPVGFVLSGGAVCKECNNGLAHLDQAVIDDFDIFAFMNGVPRKKGRPSEIRSRGNLIGTQGLNGNEISINMEHFPVVAHDGTKLGGFGKSDRNIQASFESEGDVVKISFSTSIGSKPKFLRGIVKIAFSSLAYFRGGELALSEDFDSVREFVREGKGSRPVLIKPISKGDYLNQSWPPFKSETDEYAVTFRLTCLEFCVDLSPNVTIFPMIKEKAFEMYGESGWGYLPIDT
jgi:hypothetical protein